MLLRLNQRQPKNAQQSKGNQMTMPLAKAQWLIRTSILPFVAMHHQKRSQCHPPRPGPARFGCSLARATPRKNRPSLPGHLSDRNARSSGMIRTTSTPEATIIASTSALRVWTWKVPNTLPSRHPSIRTHGPRLDHVKKHQGLARFRFGLSRLKTMTRL